MDNAKRLVGNSRPRLSSSSSSSQFYLSILSVDVSDAFFILFGVFIDAVDVAFEKGVRRTQTWGSTEASLSRQERTTLAQLRTGYCKRLNDYMHNKMTPPRAADAICPECLVRRHTPVHLFSCDACPTDLTIRDLWINSVRVISFLRTLPSFFLPQSAGSSTSSSPASS